MNGFGRNTLALLIAAGTLLGASAGSTAPAAASEAADWSQSRVQAAATEIARDLAARCPIADPGDQAAFEHCRQALYGDSQLRRSLPSILLWGRSQGLPIGESQLTQFAPDVFAGLYAPLFMFAGTAQVEFDAGEKMYRATLPARFRNRLQPGQFPYPFWHNKTKWTAYQSANAIVFYIAPKTGAIRVAQYVSDAPSDEELAQATARAAAFDGKWLWTDAEGHTQPEVTLFDGLYRPNNPFLPKIESTYKDLALELRAGECDSCHTPANPHHIHRLVLMQTPAHAAGEIKRILRTVRDGSMPHDDFGVEKPLDDDVKQRLLSKAEAFDNALTLAKTWETNQAPARQP